MLSYQTQLYIYFPSDGNILWKSICFISYGTECIFPFDEIYMYFISCGNQRIFTSRDFIQQEVLNSRKNRKSYRETSLDMSGESRK